MYSASLPQIFCAGFILPLPAPRWPSCCFATTTGTLKACDAEMGSDMEEPLAEFLCCGFNFIMVIDTLKSCGIWCKSDNATKCMLKLIFEVLPVPSHISCHFSS